MATATDFFYKVHALKPDEPVKPGSVFVAILHYDKLPTQDFEQADVLWVKCTPEKSISALIKAYEKQCPDAGEIVLKHNFKLLDSRTKVSALPLRPPGNFIALEAVCLGDVDTRKVAVPSRPPLEEIAPRASLPATVGAISEAGTHPDCEPTRPASAPVTSKSRQSPFAPSEFPSTCPSPIQADFTLHPQHNASSVDSDLGTTDLEQTGWRDFVFERLACQRQTPARRRHFPFPEHDQIQQTASIQPDWDSLNQGQKSYYIARGNRLIAIAFHTASPYVEHAGFWCFYYKNYWLAKSSAWDAHCGWEFQRSYADWQISLWEQLSWAARREWRDEGVQLVNTAQQHYDVDLRPPPRIVISPVLRQSNSEIQGSAPAARPDVESGLPPRSSHGSALNPDAANPKIDFHVDVENASQVQNPVTTRLSMAELFDGRTPEQLEKSAERGIELMTDVEKILQQNPSKDIAQWAEAIENVRKQAKRNKTIVGVVGATGAGKSSVINAIMDEERLVPTNCMRACTAVVTEISYNYEEGPKYKADIEFISRQDWLKMLKILFQEVLDGTGHVSREYTNEDSEAGVAYAQIKAVYPELTKEEMEKAPIDRLMSHANAKCLDTTLKLDSDDGTDFYKDLQSYVDSKEKTSGIKGVHDPAKKPCEMEFWPLIRVVRLYVKSPALATGAVIVDLPGVHDSNQARAAVARSYMKQCTGLWIVAPINRAVDDKSAKNLLGESFKRQLKMDGGYDSVTFICSKTDDISLTEAQDSLGLETELGPKWAKSEELRVQKKDLKRQTDSLKQTKADITAAMDVVDEELEKWEKLQEQAADGTAVYRPKEKSQKRKRTEQSSPVRKKSKYTEPDSDDDFFDDDDTRSDARSDYASPEEQGEPLTEVDIAMKIAELRSSKKDGRIEKIKADDSLKDIRRLVAAINEEAGGIDAELSAKCIAGRNEYSREAIRQDYAAGIRGLDQELAEEEDAANFDPEADARDYDEVARNLPVFCVSSRAYQKLQGRLKKDKMPPGFNQTEETEIPALQAHCIQLTTAGRQASCRKVLSSMFQLFNSLHLWALNDGTGSNLTEGQMQREAEILKGKLGKLDSALAKAVGTIVDEINDELSDKVYDVCESAISVAKSGANDTVRKWGSAVDRDNRAAGGLYWSTYKAVCRRNGSLSNVNGSNNFNEQLLEPIIQRLAGPWEAVFARRVPGILNGLPLNAAHILTSFHDDLESRAIRNGTPVISLQMLKQQILVHKETLRDAAGEARGRITEDQRDINREFEPKLTEYMVHAYDVCVQESGPGSFARMKGHMDRHVEQEKRTMFEGAIVHVQGLIKEMLETVQQELLTKVDACYLAVERDYTGVLVSQDNSSGLDALPRQQRSMRKSVLEIIDNAEQVFKRAIGLECGSANESSSMGAVEQRAFSDNDVEAEENVDTAALVQSNLEPAPATS